MRRAGWLWALLALATPGWAVDCAGRDHAGVRYTVCTVDAAAEDLRLFLNDPETGKPLGSFTNIEKLAEALGHAALCSR